ncbi:1,4-dihydroxy-2-naphthoate polyprenyltransferase [Providencia sp. PROV188]|jgi:1,4-dihydroxy-2-naphthoate octaprenyltransferase|uniref:1,4-dihydroxy-2-naphthoate octaprenyltransferase n=1 Tax=Providencia alcalifaciens TaxID=126385 RepID=A0A4V2V391_9GAMM|nr:MULTISPECIES: 1,4-dihydroxy-2-naphthoate polyprenyltransferase [Providencia]ETT01299.1 1,4-dihydroxy-2-naphthoate octaprenyltransferase [Providencia alcalifaciens PAL-3]EUC98976.1 1,4-dihydroxy-2-naphthoate octaprenyltransferase [Providencia alcalifaciens PAL-1]MBC5788652.1 1,4-dihydroxy-2-naphthoate polyprenyltransferase [Providencia sp. JUb39]MBG5884015.1 1,4-dihydroxy-2-naphthoate polyprenyltransferase [Providencia alcalifaciens]MBS0924540.1 1,4-dihydroxy-2-naphthoate polyprenyltransfera
MNSSSISRKQAWLESLRPKTLPLGVIAIVTGSALTYFTGNFKWPVALLSIITAGLLQILSNLANDYGDAIKGSDTAERIGPLRGMQKGVITKEDMKKALKLNIFAACLSGLLLIIVACEKPEDAIGFLGLGLVAIVAAITYTVGKKPYGYLGLGDISVLIFFGWLSVIGTFYLQANSFNIITILPATACGLLSVAVLNINNMRDIENDIKAGKNTLAVRLGPQGARMYHAIIIIVSILCLVFFNLLYLTGWAGWLFLLAVPMLMNHVRKVLSDPTPEGMRPMLENMVKIALVTNVLFSLGVILSK